jgi:hypothetical protein
MTRALVLGAAALALSAAAASAQAVNPSYDGPYGYGYKTPAPLYDYAGPASSAPVPASPLGYGPLIYTPQLYAPTPAFPSPPAEPGYYTAQSVVVPQRFYDYAPGYWAPGNPAAPGAIASVPGRTVRYYGHRMYMMSVNRTQKGSKLTPDNNAKPLSEWLHRP